METKECKELKDFYDYIKDLEVRGKQRNNARKELRERVKDKVKEFEKSCSDWKMPKVIQNNRELEKMLEEFLYNMKQGIQAWNNRFDGEAKREEFGEKFLDKFIVFVYGTVKAGKSTLGNFIATHHLPNQEPEFWVGERAKKETGQTNKKLKEARAEDAILKRVDIKEFKTNVIECTAEIQLFTLGGLVYVDTPGLGSTTTENGALTKRYIEEADFVLYPTGSDAPMKGKEIEEISQLLHMQKPIHIVITKSDKAERKKIDGSIKTIIVNESEVNRDNQQKDVKKRLEKDLDNKGLSNERKKFLKTDDILSISIKTADDGFNTDDKDLFENSNIPTFYAQFNTILREKSQNLKNQSPLDSIIGLINIILGNSNKPTKKSLAGMQLEYEQLQNKLEMQRKNLENSIQDLRGSILKMIAREFEMHRIEGHNYKQQCQKIRVSIGNELNAKITEACKNAMQDFSIDFCKSMESIGVAEVHDIMTPTKFPKPHISKAIGATIGGIGGLAFGPLAVASGALVGGWIGDKIDSMLASDDILPIKIGDNLNESIQNFRNELENMAKKILNDSIAEMDKSFFAPLKKQLGSIEQELKIFCQELENLRKKYEQQRN